MVEIPEPLYEQLQQRAEQSGTSVEALILEAAERAYKESKGSEVKKGNYVTGAFITGPGKLGPAFPVDENPHDLVLP
jgi:hypothetical protein